MNHLVYWKRFVSTRNTLSLRSIYDPTKLRNRDDTQHLRLPSNDTKRIYLFLLESFAVIPTLSDVIRVVFSLRLRVFFSSSYVAVKTQGPGKDLRKARRLNGKCFGSLGARIDGRRTCAARMKERRKS